MNKRISTQYLTRIAVLAALSAVLFLTLEIPIFGDIYKLDFSSLPILLAGYSMGAVPALIALAIKELIHLMFKGFGSTVGIGNLADFIMTSAFILPAVFIYKKNRTLEGALVSMMVGIASMCVVALIVNAFILFPFYMKAYHIDLAAIAGMLGAKGSSGMMRILLTTTLPFNLLKGVVISALTFLLYKRLSPLLHVRYFTGR